MFTCNTFVNLSIHELLFMFFHLQTCYLTIDAFTLNSKLTVLNKVYFVCILSLSYNTVFLYIKALTNTEALCSGAMSYSQATSTKKRIRKWHWIDCARDAGFWYDYKKTKVHRPHQCTTVHTCLRIVVCIFIFLNRNNWDTN